MLCYFSSTLLPLKMHSPREILSGQIKDFSFHRIMTPTHKTGERFWPENDRISNVQSYEVVRYLMHSTFKAWLMSYELVD